MELHMKQVNYREKFTEDSTPMQFAMLPTDILERFDNVIAAIQMTVSGPGDVSEHHCKLDPEAVNYPTLPYAARGQDYHCTRHKTITVRASTYL